MGALLTFFFGLFIVVSAGAQTPAGEYVGVLHHDSLGRDQLAKLDLIASRGKDGNPEMLGILTLWFGDFDNREYISFHYEDVIYDPAQTELVMDQADQSISVYSSHFDGVTLDADVRNIWTANPAHLHLTRDGVAQPTLPLLEPVGGLYRATCEGASKVMHLQTFRYTDDTTKIGSAFSSYNIIGAFGQAQDPSSGDGDVVTDLISKGAYNFFDGILNLVRRHPGQMATCQSHPGGWKCGPCDYLRVSDEMKPPLNVQPISAPDPFGVPVASLVAPAVGRFALHSGEFKGYLHHEFLDEYQPGSVNVLTYRVPGGNGTIRASVMARLYFGDIDSPEVIIYRFTDEDYANQKPAFILLKNREADYDAIGQVTEISEHALKGTWYSRLFGRVGTFEFRDDGLPRLPASAKFMQPLSAKWESTTWDLEINTLQGKTPINTDNPFFPNVFSGDVMLRGISAPDYITDGSYDFYTGRIGLTTESGKDWVGNILSNGLLYMEPMENTPHGLMSDAVPTPFRKSPVSPLAQEGVK